MRCVTPDGPATPTEWSLAEGAADGPPSTLDGIIAMSTSIDATVNATLALQNQSVQQQANYLLLRKALANQANTVTSLIEGASAETQPQTSSGNRIGTLVDTTA